MDRRKSRYTFIVIVTDCSFEFLISKPRPRLTLSCTSSSYYCTMMCTTEVRYKLKAFRALINFNTEQNNNTLKQQQQ